MAVPYTLVPQDMLNGLISSKRPQNLDDYLIRKSVQSMDTIPKSKKLNVAEKLHQYRSNLRNLIKTKNEVESRPVKVSIDKIQELVAELAKASGIDDIPKKDASTTTYENKLATYQNKSVVDEEGNPIDEDPFDENKSIDEVSDENDYESLSSTSQSPLNRTIQPGKMFIGDDDEGKVNVYARQRVLVPPPAPKKRLRSQETPDRNEQPTRKLRKNQGSPTNEEQKKAEISQHVFRLIKSNEATYGVKGNKILDKGGEPIKTSNLEKAIDYIVANAIGYTSKMVAWSPGSNQLFDRLSADPRYQQILNKAQGGKGLIKSALKPVDSFRPQIEDWLKVKPYERPNMDKIKYEESVNFVKKAAKRKKNRNLVKKVKSFRIEKILKTRRRKGETHVYVKFENEPISNAAWVSEVDGRPVTP